ncbi:MAG: hypothetical protein AAF573_16595 [Bacteroidota bacterium]
MRDIMILLVGFTLFSSPIFASNHIYRQVSTITQDTSMSMPKVFILGDYEKQYDQLSTEYGTSLLAANNDDTGIAGKQWSSMIKEMEAHADMLEYDINGVKMWLHVFWDQEGKINHIGFYLKPNSRNVDKKELRSFLMDFVNNYYIPSSHESKFSHYSGAAFPTFNLKRN